MRRFYGERLDDMLTSGRITEAADYAANLPPDRTSAVYRATVPGWEWGPTEHLAAAQLDVQNLLLWSKTKDGAKNRRRPKPVPRPGMEQQERATEGRFKDVEALPLDELKRKLAAPRRAVAA